MSTVGTTGRACGLVNDGSKNEAGSHSVFSRVVVHSFKILTGPRYFLNISAGIGRYSLILILLIVIVFQRSKKNYNDEVMYIQAYFAKCLDFEITGDIKWHL